MGYDVDLSIRPWNRYSLFSRVSCKVCGYNATENMHWFSDYNRAWAEPLCYPCAKWALWAWRYWHWKCNRRVAH